MAYASYNDVIIRYPIVKTWGKTEAEISSDLIYYAEMELNSRLGTHFAVPFTTVYPTVKDLSIDLSYYRALRTKDPKKANEIRKAVLGRIEDIKAGKEFIYTGSGTLEASGGIEIWSTTEDYHPVHSMLDAEDPLTDISSERLYDEADERG